MKKSRKYIGIGMIVSAVAIAAILGAANVNAHDSSTRNALVDRLTTKLNLNKDDVQKVFDEVATEHRAEMKKNFEERLQQGVEDGDITADQKAKIIAKHNEMETFRLSLEGKTAAEVREAMEAKRNEMEKWADDNNIPTGYLRFGHSNRGGGFGEGMHRSGGRHM